MSQNLHDLIKAQSNEGNECLICKEPVMDVGLPKCLHIFHRKCIISWNQNGKPNSDKCPICLQPMNELMPIDELVYNF